MAKGVLSHNCISCRCLLLLSANSIAGTATDADAGDAITYNLSGNTLALSWPADHTGWRVETNAVDIADANSWFTLPGSTTTNQIFLPINSASRYVFFRLVFP